MSESLTPILQILADNPTLIDAANKPVSALATRSELIRLEADTEAATVIITRHEVTLTTLRHTIKYLRGQLSETERNLVDAIMVTASERERGARKVLERETLNGLRDDVLVDATQAVLSDWVNQ